MSQREPEWVQGRQIGKTTSQDHSPFAPRTPAYQFPTITETDPAAVNLTWFRQHVLQDAFEQLQSRCSKLEDTVDGLQLQLEALGRDMRTHDHEGRV